MEVRKKKIQRYEHDFELEDGRQAIVKYNVPEDNICIKYRLFIDNEPVDGGTLIFSVWSKEKIEKRMREKIKERGW